MTVIVTVDTATPYTDEEVTCPSCTKHFKVRYNTSTKAIVEVGDAHLYEILSSTCKKYTHGCGSILLISNS